MSKLQQKLGVLSQKYKQLKATEEYSLKFQISKQLIKLCADAQKSLESELPSSKNVRHKSQINNIRTTALQVNKQAKQLIDNHGKRKIDMSGSSIIVTQKSNDHKNEELTYEQKSKRICQTIVEQQFSSKQLKLDVVQLQKIVQKMEKNLEIQTQIKQMLVEQNDNLDIIEESIKKTYENTQGANKELEIAVDRKLRARLRKIKLGLTGIIAVIGYGILGLPGLIAGGVVGLYKTIF